MSFDFQFTPSRGPDRHQVKAWAAESVEISEKGFYVAPSGRKVQIALDLRESFVGTAEHLPDDAVPLPKTRGVTTKITVVNGTSLASARRMVAVPGARYPMVLNFASAKNPGGGFLKGARAQEESLAWSSALYLCIRGSKMYQHHEARRDLLYTDWMIHTPCVPVFRDDVTGELFEQPYLCSFLTAAAPNAGCVLERDPSRRDEVDTVMRARIDRALAVAAAHGETRLVLGAWGCGVFKNDPGVVARAFASALAGDFAGVFDEVEFAVLDWSEDRHFIRPFVECFA